MVFDFTFLLRDNENNPYKRVWTTELGNCSLRNNLFLKKTSKNALPFNSGRHDISIQLTEYCATPRNNLKNLIMILAFTCDNEQ